MVQYCVINELTLLYNLQRHTDDIGFEWEYNVCN